VVGGGGGDADALGYEVHGAPKVVFGGHYSEKQKEEPVMEEKEPEEETERERGEGDKERADKPMAEARAHLGPPMSAGATLVRRFGSLLVGKGDESRRHSSAVGKRATILGFGPKPSEPQQQQQQQEGGGEKDIAQLLKEEEEEKDEGTTTTKEHVELRLSTKAKENANHRRAATILDPPGRTLRHERRGSVGAIPLNVGTLGRIRRPSTANPASMFKGPDRTFVPPEEQDEENAQESGVDVAPNGMNGNRQSFKDEGERHAAEKDFKPVFLKGLFRCVCCLEFILFIAHVCVNNDVCVQCGHHIDQISARDQNRYPTRA
jgi:hypothetical protein